MEGVINFDFVLTKQVFIEPLHVLLTHFQPE